MNLVQELNNIYLNPPTREVIIRLWELQPRMINTRFGRQKEFPEKDYVFTVPHDWPYGMNLWQLLISVESCFNWARQNGFNFGDDMFGGFYIGDKMNSLHLHTWH